MQGYYYVSDGGSMDFEDFLAYLIFVEQECYDFNFNEWFCEDDFSGIEAYNYLKNLFEK